MAIYTLKAFNRTLAATGFKCVMLTGSHAVGGSIEDTDSDIYNGLVNVTVKVSSGSSMVLNDNGTKYFFDDTGQCTTIGYNMWRLMLVEDKTESTSGESLHDLCEILSGQLTDLNNKLDTMNGHLADIAEAVAALA